MTRWCLWLVLSILVLMQAKPAVNDDVYDDSKDEDKPEIVSLDSEDDDKDDEYDNDEEEPWAEEKDTVEAPPTNGTTTTIGTTSTTTMTTTTTRVPKRRPLECYSCSYHFNRTSETKACLDPANYRVHVITCNDITDTCYTTVMESPEVSHDHVYRGCRATCEITSFTTCCHENRCNNQAFNVPVFRTGMGIITPETVTELRTSAPVEKYQEARNVTEVEARVERRNFGNGTRTQNNTTTTTTTTKAVTVPRNATTAATTAKKAVVEQTDDDQPALVMSNDAEDSKSDDDDDDNSEEEKSDDEDKNTVTNVLWTPYKPTTTKKVTKRTTRTITTTTTSPPPVTKRRPLECYSCSFYYTHDESKACLDPAKYRVNVVRCNSLNDMCYLSVISSRLVTYSRVKRGCQSTCKSGSKDTVCCYENRCNRHVFTMETIRNEKPSPKKKPPMASRRSLIGPDGVKHLVISGMNPIKPLYEFDHPRYYSSRQILQPSNFFVIIILMIHTII